MALLSLLSFKASAIDVDVLVRNQRFSADTFFFDIYLQSTSGSNLFLSNSDFALEFTEANFLNPTLNLVSGSVDLKNAYGNSTAFYDTNIGTNIQYSGLNAYKLMIYVQMPLYSNQSQFLDRIARIDGQSLANRLGTFYITGATALNTNPDLKWITSGKGLKLLVNHRDSLTMVKASSIASGINPTVGSEPTVQADALTITNVGASSMTVSWTAGNGSNRILLIRQDSAVNAFPTDGLTYIADTVYSQGDHIGSSDVYTLYKGSGNSVTISGLSNSTTYHFALIELNGSDGHNENYLSTNPDTISQSTNDPYITANVKVFLQGAYNTGSGLMNTALRMGNSYGSTNLLPSAQPYSASPWSYTGNENVDTANHPTNAVDWILVELRSTYNGAPVTNGQAAGFLLDDGSIVDTNGVDPIRFWGVNPGYYYVVLKHRNHLPIMTRDSISLSGSSALYDFTNLGQIQAYGTDTTTFQNMPMSNLATGIYGMRGGDMGGNPSYQIRYNGGGLNDRVSLLLAVGSSTNSTPITNTYSALDINFDRQVRYNGGGLNDRVRLLLWVGTSTNSSPIVVSIPNP